MPNMIKFRVNIRMKSMLDVKSRKKCCVISLCAIDIIEFISSITERVLYVKVTYGGLIVLM